MRMPAGGLLLPPVLASRVVNLLSDESRSLSVSIKTLSGIIHSLMDRRAALDLLIVFLLSGILSVSEILKKLLCSAVTDRIILMKFSTQ
ncbi:hypothetical protein IC582_016238 [Cucumis melo]